MTFSPCPHIANPSLVASVHQTPLTSFSVCLSIFLHDGFHLTRVFQSLSSVKIKKYHRLCWDGWTWEAFRWSRLKVFLAVALPMGLTLAFDESTFHALVLMSARLNPDDMAALGIMYQVGWSRLRKRDKAETIEHYDVFIRPLTWFLFSEMISILRHVQFFDRQHGNWS